ncbi:porin family protein [Flavobacterium sp.]|uniref:porin family protein n=1 Tax=Flavobacterium sp. TaxID=239 RepID=UPI0025C6E164|nr:porin family protein [Flavobacterium sp.]MBA4153269.1 PorT family protein [Flavobacterium sp.]
MKKSMLVYALFLIGFTNANAQLLQFGLKGGVNFSNYSGGDLEGVDFNNVTNFHFGVVTELKLLENFALQPELLYSTQGSELESLDEQIKNELGYLSIPVLVKFYLTSNKLSLEAGPQFSFLVKESGDFDLYDSNTFDFGVAAGLSYKITKGLFLSGRYVAGLTDVKKEANVKNSLVQFSLGYMF